VRNLLLRYENRNVTGTAITMPAHITRNDALKHPLKYPIKNDLPPRKIRNNAIINNDKKIVFLFYVAL